MGLDYKYTDGKMKLWIFATNEFQEAEPRYIVTTMRR